MRRLANSGGVASLSVHELVCTIRARRLDGPPHDHQLRRAFFVIRIVPDVLQCNRRGRVLHAATAAATRGAQFEKRVGQVGYPAAYEWKQQNQNAIDVEDRDGRRRVVRGVGSRGVHARTDPPVDNAGQRDSQCNHGALEARQWVARTRQRVAPRRQRRVISAAHTGHTARIVILVVVAVAVAPAAVAVDFYAAATLAAAIARTAIAPNGSEKALLMLLLRTVHSGLLTEHLKCGRRHHCRRNQRIQRQVEWRAGTILAAIRVVA